MEPTVLYRIATLPDEIAATLAPDTLLTDPRTGRQKPLKDMSTRELDRALDTFEDRSSPERPSRPSTDVTLTGDTREELAADTLWVMGRLSTLSLFTIGTRDCVLAVGRDITARRQAEEELGRHRHHLEELVNARTAELRALNLDLENFAFSVSHDLRVPLRSIRGFAHIIQEDHGSHLDPTAAAHLQRVLKSEEHMDRLIEGLLRLSRVAGSKPACDDVDLSAIASDIVEELSAEHPDRRVEWTIQQVVKSCGDGHLLRTVMFNLLENAMKFTRLKPVATISFRLMDAAEAKARWNSEERIYCISDNGVGFDQEYEHKMFRPFSRLHSSEMFAGTGIGLATVRRIIERHGGRIWAVGKPDEGATLFFTAGCPPSKDSALGPSHPPA